MRLFRLLMMMFMAVSVSSVSAQDCRIFFPDEEGTVREMTSYNKKDKVTGKTVQKTVEKEVTGEKVHLVVETHIFDDKDQEVSESLVDLYCEDGVFKIDMSQYLSEVLSAYQSMEVSLEGDQMVFPAGLSVGDELPDASMKITVMSNGITMINMDVIIENRKVLDKESITTPAGSFDCFKLSYDLTTKNRLVTVNTSTLEWVSEGVGIVKSENYNSKDKLISYSLLTGLD